MTKKDLIETIRSTGITKQKASEVIELIFDSMKYGLKEGEGQQINIIGFGTFKTVDTAERIGRNPKTGEAVKIPAGKVVKFKASKEILK